jgi:hypothetical protein
MSASCGATYSTSLKLAPPAPDCNEEVASLERDRLAAFHLNTEQSLPVNTEQSLPAQEQLVFVVVVPGELAVEKSDTDHGIVDRHQILRFPGLQQVGCDSGQRNRRYARSVASGWLPVSGRHCFLWPANRSRHPTTLAANNELWQALPAGETVSLGTASCMSGISIFEPRARQADAVRSSLT